MPDEDSARREDRRHDQYLEEYRDNVRACRESSRSYDKVLVTVSSGALGFSILFVDKFTGEQISAPWLLACAWAGFGAAMVSTMISIYLSPGAFEKKLTHLTERYRSRRPEDDPAARNIRSDTVLWFNRASLILFVIGVILLVAFATQNLKGAQL